VSGLGGVHTLNMSFCSGMTDESAHFELVWLLRNYGEHILDFLSHCSSITDVSGLVCTFRLSTTLVVCRASCNI
jgi:hypothetical protein